MYRFWEPVVEPLLERLEPKVIVEIGSDQGFNTRNLLGFARRTGAKVHVIDPLPKFDASEWLRQYPENLVFHRALSLDALDTIGDCDAVLIDGDHNWHTVFNELKALESTMSGDPNRYPLVLLHDVGWPYARRDLYYEPDRIPGPDRHPYRREGLRPGRADLDPEGGLNGHLFNALREGGPRNGVLTAVEDFISESSLGLEFLVVPSINDLGILFPSDLTSALPAVGAFIDDLGGSPALSRMLERVEALRIDSQIEALDAQRSLTEARSILVEQDGLLYDLDNRIRSVEQDRDRNASDVDRLRAELDALRNISRLERSAAEAAVATAHSESVRTQSALASHRKNLEAIKKELSESNRKYRRLRSRRSVRLALTLAHAASPLVRLVRRFRSRRMAESNSLKDAGKPHLSQRSLTRVAQSTLAKRIARRRPGSERSNGPLVSIVVLTRNGAEHLGRLFSGLEKTIYRSFEVVVVDNGSTDETTKVLQSERNFLVKLIRHDHNTSFSEGNNQGVGIAEGEFLLFLNNDIEPINPGWLGAMVDAIRSDESIVAAGAELVYPVRGLSASDLTVQHAGIRFAFRDGAVHAVNVGGHDPLDGRLEGTFDVPAATAAALMVKATAFRSVGGFDEGYVYGTEDVDLCLKLGDQGKIVVTGQAVLFHHESATQTRIAAEITQINRIGNRQRLAEHWSPRLARSVIRDRLTGTGYLTSRTTRTVAITMTHNDVSRGWGDYYTAHELGDAFAASGWGVFYAERYQDHWYEIDEDIDLVISLLDSYDVRMAPDGAFTVAWVRNWVDRWLEQPWFEDYDLVATSSRKAGGLVSQHSRYEPALVPMATNLERFQPGPPNPTFEGDYVFTGNNWGPGRNIVRWLDVHPEERFTMFGKGWDKDPHVARYWRGSLDYDLLPEVYRSTKIVLDDTATPTLPYAFLNGRVFDALASGALVLTDNVAGSEEMFQGMLPTFSSRGELREQLDRFLTNDDQRTELVGKLREHVAENHSYNARPTEFVQISLDHIERPRVAVKVAVPNEDVKSTWGDTHFGGALASALTRMGLPTEVHILPEWDLPANQAVDIVIHLRGLTSYTPKPAHINVLWVISHPDDVSVHECKKYDLVLVASSTHADWLRSQIETPVVYMPQATDERRFHLVDPDSDLATEVLFVGNSRGQKRPAVDWAISRGLPLTVYGGGWNGRIPAEIVRADHYPNEQLAVLYASAKVVLNDHWPDMREHGFISNRVFDALASGVVVVSDRAEGLEEMFGDLVPTYSHAGELEEVVNGLLGDEGRRKEISHSASALVAEKHTFSQRAEQLVELIWPLLSKQRKDLEGNRLAG